MRFDSDCKPVWPGDHWFLVFPFPVVHLGALFVSHSHSGEPIATDAWPETLKHRRRLVEEFQGHETNLGLGSTRSTYTDHYDHSQLF